MSTYYVFIPGKEDMAVEVLDSPDARHARTAFLDYLSRGGKILYSQRGDLRKRLKTIRIQQGESNAPVTLSYAEGTVVEGLGEPEVSSTTPFRTPEGTEFEPEGMEPGEEEDDYVPGRERLEDGEEFEEEFEEEFGKPSLPQKKTKMLDATFSTKDVFGAYPIMDLSRKTGAM